MIFNRVACGCWITSIGTSLLTGRALGFNQPRATSGEPGSGGEILAFLAAAGGVGATTLAIEASMVHLREAKDAVWSYEQPYPAMREIEGRLAFYPKRVDAIEVLKI